MDNNNMTMWYKPIKGSGIIKNGDLKQVLKKSVTPMLLECLYLDTADLTLIHHDAVLMIVDDGTELKQMAVFADGEPQEFTTTLPESGLDLSLFPGAVYEKLIALLNGALLQIRFVSVFEQKKGILSMDGMPDCLLVRMLSHYEDSDGQKELCTLSVQSMEEDAAVVPTAEQLLAFDALTPCLPPFIEAMRLCSSGCIASADIKRIKKQSSMSLAFLLRVRLFELAKALSALETDGLDPKSIVKLRVESRRLSTLIEIFEETVGDKAASYKNFLQTLIDDTEQLRSIDIIADEIITVASMHREFNFSALWQRLAENREALCETFLKACQNGSYSDELAACWVNIHEILRCEPANEDMIKATEKIREWTVDINVYKKAELSNIESIHEYRRMIRKLKYALEGLSEMTVKRLSKAIKACKKIQDEFGKASDIADHMKMLQKMSSQENNAELALLCGICCGVFADSLSVITIEAINVWKDCRKDLKALEDTL